MTLASSPGPLASITVLELASIGPVPFVGSFLAQLGANVIRVERPDGIDSAIPVERGRVRSGKTVETIDLKTMVGVDRVLELVEQTDVLVEGHRPGVMERLRLGPEICFSRNPDLVYARMTGWGQDGPLAQRAGHDINYISITGALNAIGAAAGPPAIPLNLVGDYGGGALYLMVGVLAALHDVRTGGSGQVVDAAIVDGVTHMLSGVHSALALGLWTDRRHSNWMDGGTPFYTVYETSDAKYMAVSAVEEKFYRTLTSALGIDTDLAMRANPERHAELKNQLAAAFRARTQREWTDEFYESDCCVTPILSINEAGHHPHLIARGTVVERGGEFVAGPAPRFTPRSEYRERSPD